jgi:fumarate hydratase class I
MLVSNALCWFCHGEVHFVLTGNENGRAFRDLNLEKEIHQLTQRMGIGAQFGGKYFCHDVRVVRLPRHGASCPVGIGVSCSADRQV